MDFQRLYELILAPGSSHLYPYKYLTVFQDKKQLLLISLEVSSYMLLLLYQWDQIIWELPKLCGVGELSTRPSLYIASITLSIQQDGEYPQGEKNVLQGQEVQKAYLAQGDPV